VNEPGSNAETFVVRVWLEAADDDEQQATWRGHVTHVMSGERRYVQSLAVVVEFIEGYLGRLGRDANDTGE
jgi:hypothetical protein